MTSRGVEEILSAFRVLSAPAGSGDLYSAQEVSGRPAYRVAMDPQGCPTLLVAAAFRLDSEHPPRVELPNLSFRPRCVCRLRRHRDEEAIETLAVLKCLSTDPMLRNYFLRSLAVLISGLPDEPSERDLADAVIKLIELFRALEASPRASLQGLWCELFLIEGATHIRQAAVAWHGDPGALHDFTAGRQRVEVKSTVGPHRIHHFVLDQLLPQRGTDVIVASFVLEERSSGTSLSELWERVSRRSELTPELRERLSKILALGLGRDWRRAAGVAFDSETATNQMRLFDSNVIPTVNRVMPAEVAGVSFRSELTAVPHLSRSEVARRGGLFASLFG